jgi:hypothetical protein
MALRGRRKKVVIITGLEKGITVFLGGLITIAVFTTLVKPGSQTPQVLNAAGGAISGSLLASQGQGG